MIRPDIKKRIELAIEKFIDISNDCQYQIYWETLEVTGNIILVWFDYWWEEEKEGEDYCESDYRLLEYDLSDSTWEVTDSK